ncbi:NUDIX domain protein [Jannaschia seosinensis]|uniref:NUDIX domain protein n=1 Tax=Jannaschia seosinensis TaxID=313367 RepID=A0A0M7BBX8_9RHOB|nr:NUDIX hydrolase [Jannaschia seosinensis]CUH39699.1 NUDIX domain protein [Jannaschia seosinensis]
MPPDLVVTPIRDAATIILLRNGVEGPRVLMGQRGAKAVFMPSKYVFPGGAVDVADGDVPMASPLDAALHAGLTARSVSNPQAIAAAAIRELAEETGQVIGAPGAGCDWPGFEGLIPDPQPLRFVFRAVTPPGPPRRFDARFFLANADAVCTDPDDFSAAEDELGHLHWVPLAEARQLDMPFITEIVLAEITALIEDGSTAGVPFLDNSAERSAIHRL